MTRLLIGAVLAALIVAVAARARALSPSGAIAAFFVGAVAYGAGGFAVAVPLIAFFLSGSLLSRLHDRRARDARAVAYKGSTRDAVQVLANGGVAALCTAASGLVSSAHAERFVAAAIGALAAAAADTWATEIGILSRTAPRSIVTWKPVRAGVSGGVTALGFLASVAGGAMIGAIASAAQVLPAGFWRWTAFGAVIGLAGSVFDSFLGATIQSAWQCNACGEPCEGPTHRCGASAGRTRGLGFFDNDAVNAATTVAGAALGWIASGYFR